MKGQEERRGEEYTVDRRSREVSEGVGTKAWARFGKHCKEREQPGQRPGSGNVVAHLSHG